MIGDGNVLEFPTGRRMNGSRPCSVESVARLVECLAQRRSRAGTARVGKPLSIGLTALTGFDDETVEGLAALTANGTITADCAARLAMRHAAEQSRTRSQSQPSHTNVAYPQLTTTLAGDVFDDFAFHLRRSSAWLGFATWRGIPHLYEICPPDPDAICLLIGCDAARRNVVRIKSPPDWRRHLAEVGAAKSRQSIHHVVLLGGLPAARGAWRAVIDQLHRGLLAAGNTVRAESRAPTKRPNPRGRCTPSAVEILTLIEIAMPGLVERVPQNPEDDR